MKLVKNSRQMNAKMPHVSSADLPEEMDAAKNEIMSRINASSLPQKVKDTYIQQANELSDLDRSLDNFLAKVNGSIDKINAGGSVINGLGADGFQVMTPDEYQQYADQIKAQNDRIEELNRERESASEERKAKIDQEIKEAKAKRAEGYEYASKIVDTCASSTVDFTKKIISGNPDLMVDAILDALTEIFSILPKGIALGISKLKAANDVRKAGKKLSDEDLKKLEKVHEDVLPPTEGDYSAMEPMTPEEAEEVDDTITKDAFDEVGEITDWESAIRYGLAKLKQIHGINFDEDKAMEVLNGLKDKYPDNPKVVIGALKFGGHRKKTKSNEEKNSRGINSILSDKSFKVLDKYLPKISISNWKSGLVDAIKDLLGIDITDKVRPYSELRYFHVDLHSSDKALAEAIGYICSKVYNDWSLEYKLSKLNVCGVNIRDPKVHIYHRDTRPYSKDGDDYIVLIGYGIHDLIFNSIKKSYPDDETVAWSYDTFKPGTDEGDSFDWYGSDTLVETLEDSDVPESDIKSISKYFSDLFKKLKSKQVRELTLPVEAFLAIPKINEIKFNSRLRDFRKLNSVTERYLQESFDKLIRDNGWNRGEYDTDEAFLVKDDSAYLTIFKDSLKIYRLCYYVNQATVVDEKSANIDDLIDIAKDIIRGKKVNSRTSNAISMNYVDEAKNLLYQIDPSVTESELQKLCDFGFGLAADPQDFIDVLKDKLAKKSNNSREKVDEETLAKAKESGVIQMKPNGSWGIISLKKGEWWTPDYESEEAAQNALKAYHAGRFGNSDTGKIYAQITTIDEGQRISGDATGPFDSVADAKEVLGFKIWTEESGSKSRVELVPESWIDTDFCIPIQEFIDEWNRYCTGVYIGSGQVHIFSSRLSNSRKDVVNEFSGQIDNDNFIDITKKMAKKLKVSFDANSVPSTIKNFDDFYAWAMESDSNVNDELFMAISELSDKYGCKVETELNSRQCSSIDYAFEAHKLFKKLNPSESKFDIDKLVNFGLRVAVKPEDLINSLKAQISSKSR